MAQKTDLNISPYYDDFDSAKNYHKVLFKPGFPVQARELTTLQSILQNQIKDFGDHMFKEGSIVIPGAPTLDNAYNAVKLQATQFSIDISLYTSELIGKTLIGQTSGVSATVVNVVLPDGGNIEDTTIYVKYLNSSTIDFETSTFTDGEGLYSNTNITYGNTTINTGTILATLISKDAIFTGSAASVDAGVYFVRGNFVNVTKQTIILDHYSNNPTYRVGLQINEDIITAKDDSTLYDNAKGFTNYAAPGADRLKITLVLIKKDVADKNDTNFIEILRTNEGDIRKIQEDTQYNLIRQWIAGRTFDESGNYSVDNFDISVDESLNNKLGNGGVYFSDEKTEQGNTPSKDLACYKVSAGKAYVRGYDVRTDGTSIVDVEKPRDTEKIETANIPFEMGNRIELNNVKGQPSLRSTVQLCSNIGGNSTDDGIGPFQPATLARFPGIIGRARLYEINTADTVYEGKASTRWDAYLYDVTFFTYITTNREVGTNTNSNIEASTQVKGKSSNAIGYLYLSTGTGTFHLTVSEVQGQFQVGETLIFNGVEDPHVTVRDIDSYSFEDVKSVYQLTGDTPAGYVTPFTADMVLRRRRIDNIESADLSNNVFTSGGTQFVGIKTGDLIEYNGGYSTGRVYNRVDSISSDNLSLNMAGNVGIPSSTLDVYVGDSLAGFSTGAVNIHKRIGVLRNKRKSALYVNLPEVNISSVDFAGSELIISAQATNLNTSSNKIEVNLSNITDGDGQSILAGFFESYKSDRYAVFQTGANTGVATVRSDQVTSTGAVPDVLTITDMGTHNNNVVNVTVKKSGIVSKVKNLTKSNILDVTLSRDAGSGIGQSTTLYDGLTYNKVAYGLRVQDEEISLNVPDAVNVIAVYESVNISQPVLDMAEFSATANVGTNAIIGENIIGENSNAIARVVTNNGSTPSTGDANKLGIVYLNDDVFEVGENVKFEESDIVTLVTSLTNGTYTDVTKSFRLQKAQYEQYYDYSRLVRRETASIPSRRLMVIFDKFTVPANDNGDVFTVLSYPEDTYTNDIPIIGVDGPNVRASDVLDFRPRVSDWVSTTQSPFFWDARNSFANASPKWIVAPKEASIMGYEYYLGRIDRIYLDANGTLQLQKGVSAQNPLPPENINDAMELGTITLPPYLYNTSDARITLADNRRYTMRDIGTLEDRIESLETVTTLSLLEVSTETLRIVDSTGRDKFKSGFFVDNFESSDNIDYSQGAALTVDTEERLIRPIISRNSLDSFLMPKTPVTDNTYDSESNYELLDTNVQKTGNVVTLKYEEVGWIEQPLATRLVNVNEFHVEAFHGTIELNPSSDNWVRTIRLDDNIINQTESRRRIVERISQTQDEGTRARVGDNAVVTNRTGNRTTFEEVIGTTRHTETQSRDVVVDTGDEEFMRSRNTAFLGRSFRGNTRHYQFLDGESRVDFIPKLIEIANDDSLNTYGSDGVFRVGETVFGYNQKGERKISFRVAQSNHKLGRFNGTTSNNDPLTTYGSNPYEPSEKVQVRYTSTSKVLNVDTNALAAQAQGKYFGYVKRGFKLVGQESGAISYVKNIRLISDSVGDILGSFFIRDPHKSPKPSVIIKVGRKEYALNNRKDGAKPLKGSKLGSYGSTEYETRGTFVTRQRNITRTRVTTDNVRETQIFWRRDDDGDPLAQTFSVAGDIQAPDPNETIDDDKHGAYITSVDVWFSSKDPGNAPVTAQIRTVELGTPTLLLMGPPVTLTPDQVNVSPDASVATNFKFPRPIYLPPGESYALVLMSPYSSMYECHCARFGETTVETQSLPNSQAVKYSVQWAMGSLFVSQNGSTWTARQTDDLKMKLYKAKFTSEEGTAYFSNPTLSASNGFSPTLSANPIITFPKSGSIKVGGVGIGTYENVLTPGVQIQAEVNESVHATITGIGYPLRYATGIGALDVTSGGRGYEANVAMVETTTLTGKGSGLKFAIASVDSFDSGVITGITTDSGNLGSGYQIGDMIGIKTSTTQGQKGTGAVFTITPLGVRNTANAPGAEKGDTIFLTNIQGTSGSNSFKSGSKLQYRNSDEDLVTSGTLPTYGADLVTDAFPNDGKTLLVNHFNHNMHTGGNKVTLSDIRGVNQTPLIVNLTKTETGSLSVGAGSTTPFDLFEGVRVSPTNYGYVKIEDEVIRYSGVDASGTLTGLERGIDSTLETTHGTNTTVEKYEVNGVSLRRINRTHNLAATGIGLNSYYIQIDRTVTGPGIDRNTDDNSSSPKTPQISFTNQAFLGGDRVVATENIQFDAIIPNYDARTPGGVTEISSSVRTVSGTSIDGNESSFVDQGYEPIQLNTLNEFTTPRLVASQINETTYLDAIARNKSFTTAIKMTTENHNVSPIIHLNIANTEYRSNLVNNPISDYPNDSRVNTADWDPNAAIYVSKVITLDNPADSLKVIFDAIRSETSTIRVLYSALDMLDQGVYRLFPGYENMNDTTGDGRGNVVVDPAKNSGLPDTFVAASPDYQEYQYTADNIGEFTSFRIKIVMTGTNQAQPPKIKNLRTIAVL